jgi:hypothetical protein
MITTQQLFDELISSLRNVIAPAIGDPYPKAQAYMAAVILEFLSRQVEERRDIAADKSRTIAALFSDLSQMEGVPIGEAGGVGDHDEAHLAKVIEELYERRESMGEARFLAVQSRVRRALRELLDLDIKVAGKAAS